MLTRSKSIGRAMHHPAKRRRAPELKLEEEMAVRRPVVSSNGAARCCSNRVTYTSLFQQNGVHFKVRIDY